jgi:hypothetical protein
MTTDCVIEDLLRRCTELRQEVIQGLCASDDPVRAELGNEMASGRVTTLNLIYGSAYRDLLEEAFDDRRPKPEPTSVRHEAEDEDLAGRSWMVRGT